MMKSVFMGATLAVALGMLISGVVAQQPGTTQADRDAQNRLQRQSNTDRQFNQGTQSAQTSKSIVRASEIIGMEVKNEQDEDLGAIEDLAIDPNTGRVAYAAVSMGGFLGLGDKLFAVPWNAIECRSEEGSLTGERNHVAILNVNKEKMDNAEGFDQDNWPDMGDERWQQDNDHRYRSTLRQDSTEQQRRSF